MLVNAGEKLGPYEMLAPLGAGGMGEVWKARDTRLDRIVAVKFSKEHFNENFEREAHAIAALNHAHICQLYDVGALASGSGYLVMEFLEGEPIVSSTRPGPMPFDQALKLAIQMADALDAAHRRGIVHRDLKPANVLITKAGVKILDFGLATIDQTAPFRHSAGLPAEQVPTEEMWEAGTIVGTLQYSSPEQLQGKPTDARSDIFSFGVLLFEMLTGRPAFSADNAASLVAEVLKSPPLSVMAIAPPALSRVLNRCLAADPDERWQSARDLRVNLQWIAWGLPEAAPVETRAISKSWWLGGVVALLLLGALGGGLLYSLRPAPPSRTVKLSILAPDGSTLSSAAIAGPPALSPDGKQIAFVADQSGQQTLWVRSLDSLTARELPGTDGARSPFWSPDSRALGFFSQDKLKRIDPAGGQAESLANVPGGFGASGTWGAGDQILYAPSNLLNLFLIAASGGQPLAATTLETADAGHFWPVFLPGGQHFLYSTLGGQQVFRGTFGSQKREVLLPSANRAVYVPAYGHYSEALLFIRNNTLTMQAFDGAALRGEPRPVAEGVGANEFSVSTEGTLAYRTAAGGPNVVTLDRNGKQTGSLGKQTTPIGGMRFSPDGRTVAIVRGAGRSQDVWLHDLLRDVTSRFTFNGGTSPVWSPDGAWIVFLRPDGLYAKTSDGSGSEQRIYSSANDAGMRNATDWSSDGHYLMVGRTDARTGFDIWLLPDPLKPGAHKLLPLLVSPMNEGLGRFANGPGPPKWVAYASDESGTNEIYVTTVPGGPSGKWQISNGGGYAPRWALEGRELYFVGPDLRTVMEVDVEPGALFRPGQAHALFKLPAQLNGATTEIDFAVSPDGKRFLVSLPVQESVASGIQVILNWQADLGK